MASLERSHKELGAMSEDIRSEIAERSAQHEARMARLERHDLRQEQKLDEMRRQTRELVREVSRMDAERKVEAAQNRAEHARNEEEHRGMMAALRVIQERLSSS